MAEEDFFLLDRRYLSMFKCWWDGLTDLKRKLILGDGGVRIWPTHLKRIELPLGWLE